jgi:hypothetical protein
MMPAERAELLALIGSAHRERGPHGAIHPHRAWFDLDEPGRQEAFEDALRLRALEAALDPAGLSTTARAVLARITAPR